jgi:hypothetical protein
MDGGFTYLLDPPPLKLSPVFTLTNADSTDPTLPEVKAIWDYISLTPYTIIRVNFDIENVSLILPKTRPFYRIWNISQSAFTTYHRLTLRSATGHIIQMLTEQVDILLDDTTASGYTCLQKAAYPFPV